MRLRPGEQSGRWERPHSARRHGAGHPGLWGQRRALGFTARRRKRQPGVLRDAHAGRWAGGTSRCLARRLARFLRRELASDQSVEMLSSGRSRDAFRRVTNNTC